MLRSHHTHLIAGESLFLPHVFQQVQCLRENTHLVPMCGEMGGEQDIPEREGENERERDEGG